MKYNIKNILISFGDYPWIEDLPKYLLLYKSIKSAILNNVLSVNVKLPPTRLLAQDLEISRSTVNKAYELLVLERYVKVVKGSGYYVSFIPKKYNHQESQSGQSFNNFPQLSQLGKNYKANSKTSFKSSNKDVAFRPGLPPLDIFPVNKWKSLLNNYWKNVKASDLSYSNTIGLKSLRQNISNYLKIYRNIICDPEQIIVTTGSLHSLYLIGQALIDKNDGIIMENPTYPLAHQLFNSLKAKIYPLSVDNEGITLSDKKFENLKLIYTTPSNQYPSGVKMSLQRRIELLQWISDKSAFVIEDDYDHEFSNWDNPIPSVYSLDDYDRVIYLGTFNKLLHPSLRIGYMIIPFYLLDTIEAIYSQSSRFVPPSTQKTLSAFIEKDYLNHHLRNILEVTEERKQIFSNHFTQIFENKITLNASHPGLHIIGALGQNIEDKILCNEFIRNNVTVHPLSNYFIGNETKNGLVMGYSSVNNKRIKDNIIKMGSTYKAFIS